MVSGRVLRSSALALFAGVSGARPGGWVWVQGAARGAWKVRAFFLVSALHRLLRQCLLDPSRTRLMREFEHRHSSRVIALIDLILHAPGGLVLAAEQLAHAVVAHRAKVTVFISHYAMSGGALLALAAKEIVVGPHASMSRFPIRRRSAPRKAAVADARGGRFRGPAPCGRRE